MVFSGFLNPALERLIEYRTFLTASGCPITTEGSSFSILKSASFSEVLTCSFGTLAIFATISDISSFETRIVPESPF